MNRLPDSPLLGRPLPSLDAEMLYQSYSEVEVPRDHRKGCPTCHKNMGVGRDGVIILDGEEWQCNCADQLQRYKWYLASGVGYSYQVLRFSDFKGDPAAAQEALDYLEHDEGMIRNGMGIMFLGDFATGKTMLPMLMFKHFIRSGYRCYATTLNDLVTKTVDSWWDRDAKKEFRRKIESAHIMLIDDAGKEHAPEQGSRASSILDSILRERVQHSRPTFITTNLTMGQFEKTYRASTFSLIREKVYAVPVKNLFGEGTKDFRTFVRGRTTEEVLSGNVRAID